MALLFAHNFVETFKIGQQTSETVQILSVVCEEEQCILYSGDVDFERKLVAAGTVFRVLILWDLATGAILHKLRGHTGVIFDTLILHSKHQASVCSIASVSDDRSVRIWSNGA